MTLIHHNYSSQIPLILFTFLNIQLISIKTAVIIPFMVLKDLSDRGVNYYQITLLSPGKPQCTHWQFYLVRHARTEHMIQDAIGITKMTSTKRQLSTTMSSNCHRTVLEHHMAAYCS